MTIAAEIAWDDSVLPFQLDRADIRGRIARLDRTLESILSQHRYPAPVAALVAEAALLTALIGQTIKLRWKLSLQIRGDGPIRIVATDYFSPTKEGEAAKVRAWASFDADRLADASAAPAFSLLGKGMFAILIDQGAGTTPYQGITPLAGDSIARCAETYFAQSEQLSTRFQLALGQAAEPGEAARWRAGGVMVQHMPKASPFARQEATGEDGLLAPEDMLDGEDAENWNRVNLLLDTAEEMELIGPRVAADQLLVRLFHQEAPRVFPAQPVRFGCTCSEQKVRDAMSIYSARDVATMTTDAGTVTADCQFCGAHCTMDPETLGFEAKG